ncbi:response regulator transcription factor [Cohnella rhizosphaerae]|uniref:Response regulator transcription factor n=1 Tax=Cohnella rhizosphaerae TaxID=1457232 RepID=A0A9X4QS68_9BACL|nr:response regulator transcription factor [Cohnella rhizosphaerae]MDG0809023.1 response regulator transcription factor [Cohnella rhizosphaerae]
MNGTKILIVEDEAAIADLLAYGLGREGFRTQTASTGAEALREAERFEPDLLLLDWMLPDMSGLDLCRRMTAERNIPILMLTARSDITDKVLGLEFGADDYMTKPFDMREVVARIRTILRRMAQSSRATEESGEAAAVRFGGVEIAVGERLVRKGGETVELTPKEFDLLMTLHGRRGKIFTRAELLDLVWGYDFAGDTRTVDTHVLRLRKKLDAGDWITTVFGIGYKFEKRED